MMRLEQAFERAKLDNRAALVTYIMAYDPNLETSLSLMKQLPSAGADVIELGLPFSDPMADGPVIQKAAVRALNAGASTGKVLEMVKEFRADDDVTPIVLMGYYNPIYHYGVEAFVEDAVAAGVDGVIIVDLPPEEEAEFVDVAEPKSCSLVRLTAPTTDSMRAQKILKRASGFVYYISVAGVTGAASAGTNSVKNSVNMLKQLTELPVAVGFGIKTAEQVQQIAQVADGVVVGSAFVSLLEEYQEQGLDKVLQLVKDMSVATGKDLKKQAV